MLEGAQQKITNDLTEAATPAGTAAGQAAGQSMTQAMGQKMTSAGGALSKGLTVPLAAVGAAAVKSWKEVDAGLDIIVQKTGASGEALDEMHGILNDITTSIPTDFETAGEAIGEVNTRFGLTGEALEELSGQFVKFAKLNGTDVTGSVDSVQKALSAFGMDASEASHMLDVLNKVGQDTGVSVDTLTSGLIQNATAFQQMGLSSDQAAVFMEQMEKSGANAETVMQGMRKALKNAAEDGKDMNTALAELQDSILNGTDGMDGLTAAYDLFGKSGDQIYGAIQNGTLDFTALGDAAIDAGDSVSSTFEETLDPLDTFQTTLNELKILGADIVTAAGPALTDMLSGVADAVQALSDAWSGLSPEMQDMVIKVAAIAAVAGPLLIIGGKIVGSITTITGAIGGIAGKLGGLGSAATTASAPVAGAATSFGTFAGQALKMIAAAAALYIAAQAISVMADAAIRIADSGGLAIGVLAGMAVAIGVLMAVASAVGPGLTAGALGIAAFGAAMLGIGEGINLACTGISKVTDSVSGLVDTISKNAPGITSIVESIGSTVDGTITTISEGIVSIIDAISGGLTGVLDSVAGIITGFGEAALNAGTGFEKLSGAVIELVNGTGVMDLGFTLGAVATGVGKINEAASGAGASADSLAKVTNTLNELAKAGATSSASMTAFSAASKTSLAGVASAFAGLNLAGSMSSAINGAISVARSGINTLKWMFSSTSFSFYQHIDVPHFSMSGSFDAKSGTVPTISTVWYAKAAELGAIFKTPQIIGVGDASQPEILLGEEKLKELVKGGDRKVVNYITVNGAEDPEAWASKFARQIKLEMRMA